MKLLIADKLEDQALQALRALPGLEVVSQPGIGKDALPDAMAGVGILIVRGKQVSAAVFERADALQLVVRAGAGVNTIDVKAASARGVFVANCPGKNAIAVAELAIGLMLALDRRLPDAVASLRAGRWDKGEYGKADGLFGKALGVAGLGAIGREVLLRGRALGLRGHVYSRSLTAEGAAELGVTRHDSLRSLAAASDILSLHLPLTAATRGAVNAEVLGALPARATLINTARAEVVDHAALAEVVRTRGLRVGLDVLPGEPEAASASYSHELLALPGVIATPHVGASTAQAQLAIADEAVRIVASFLKASEVPNCVNVAVTPPAHCQLVTRHLDRVGVLASLLGVIKQHGINVGEMQNRQFEGGAAATAVIRLGSAPPPACIEELRRVPDVLHIEVVML